MTLANEPALPELAADQDSKRGSGKARGAFIVLEGLDRSGKSTQVGLLEGRLGGEGFGGVVRMGFPGGFVF